MAKFRYIIIDEFGNVSGTNDREHAGQLYLTDCCEVIDTAAGTFWAEDDSDQGFCEREIEVNE